MNKLAEIRPRLKRHTIFLQTSAGVFFPGEGTPFLLKGKAIAHWISTLVPYMNGQHTLEELSQGLSPERRDMLIRLITVLIEKGLVKNYLPEDQGLLPLETCQRFRTQIEYIDHYTDHPVQRFKKFRESHILLVGSGESYLALARLLVRNGLQQLFLAPLDEPDRYADSLQAELPQLLEGGRAGTITLAGRDYQEAMNTSQAYDLVVYCADRSSLKTLADLHAFCFQHGQTFLPAFVFAGQAILGPLVRPHTGPCWLCAQMHLLAHQSAAYQAAFWRLLALDDPLATHEPALFAPVARRIGNGLAFELFKVLTGSLPPETERGVLVQNLETLEASHNPVLQHPLCPICTHPGAQQEGRELEELVTGQHDCQMNAEDLFKQATARFINAQTGIFQAFTDDALLQLPLKVTKLVAPAPASPLSDRLEVTAYSIENLQHARSLALPALVSAYAQSLPDPRRMLRANQQELHNGGYIAIIPTALSTFSGLKTKTAETRREWLPAFSLLRQSTCYVPAAALYPCSALNRWGEFPKTPIGSAAGTTYQQLLQEGLFSALTYEHLRRLLQGQNSLIRHDLRELSFPDPDLTFLLKCAVQNKREIALFEVYHDAPLHLMVAHTRTEVGDLTCTGTGLSGPAALAAVLLNLLGDLQILQSEDAYPPARNTLDLSAHAEFLLADPSMSRLFAPATAFAELEAYIHASGREILIANTTPTGIWETGTWMSGTVLLTHPVGKTHDQLLVDRL